MELPRKTKIISVVYNASNNEFVRTNTLVKSSIIYIDATPFKNMFLKKLKVSCSKQSFLNNKESNFTTPTTVNSIIEDQIKSGRLLARICSRPGQTGRADGYIVEGSELEFYQKKIQKKI
jgi:small subunit ribosomal protein S8e